MEAVLELHARLATAIVLYLVALGIWGAGLAVRGLGPTPAFRGAIVVIEVVVIAQGLAGVTYWITSAPADAIHALYGVALALALPLAMTMVREVSPRRAALALGLVAFFAAGLALRGIGTA